MKADWDARARRDPLWYIACDEGKDEAQFLESGWRAVAMLLEGLIPLLPGRESALEIGCGIGRLLELMTGEFRELYGVDISGEMVRQGRDRLASLPQIHLVEVDGTGGLPFPHGKFDLCFSFITFHHIPAKEVVCRYIAEAKRVLKPGGIFRFHLFGRPEGVLQAVRERFTKKNTWRGCKFTHHEIRTITERAGFEVIESRYVEALPGRPGAFFGKVKPDAIWVTARRPAVR
jgi:SAM-dependent methyltransferase